MWLLHPNFKKVFSAFGLIPFISAVCVGFSFFILALVDATQGIIIDVDNGFATFLIWMLIGAVSCVIVYGTTVLFMAPMMAQFDAIMDIRNKVVGEEVPKTVVPDDAENSNPIPAEKTNEEEERPVVQPKVLSKIHISAPPIPEPTPETHWTCPLCNKENLLIMTKCVYCDTERK
ncbi:MAG: hypothetical protein IJF38_00695 [Clostridia bacterium]|nr:hypothetical protein [Clostridia bacterium]